MTHDEVTAILCCIIEHIRPDGDFRHFTYQEVELLNNLVKEHKKIPAANQCLTGKKIIRIGDEVIVGNKEHGYLSPKFILTGFGADGKDAYLLNPENGAYTIAHLKACHKTGKYFPQIGNLIGKPLGIEDE